MNIYEEFEQEDIETIEKLVKEELRNENLGWLTYAILDLISNVAPQKIERNIIDEELVKEIADEYGISQEEVPEKEVEKTPFVESIEANGISLDDALDIILNDEKIVDVISDEIEENLNFEDDYPNVKKANLEVLGDMVLLLQNVLDNPDLLAKKDYLKDFGKLDQIKEIINDAIVEMDFTDFAMLMTQYVGEEYLTTDAFFKDSIIEKINNMNPEEYAFYLRNIKNNNASNPEIYEVEKAKAEEINSEYINYLYNCTRKNAPSGLIIKEATGAFKLDEMELYRYTAINSILKEKNKCIDFEIPEEEVLKKPEYRMYITMLEKLEGKEFISFMLRNGNDSLFKGETKIIEQKLNRIPKKDLIMLTNRLCFLELNFNETLDKSNEPSLLKVAKKRGIVSKKNELICSDEEMGIANEKLWNYASYTNSIAVPIKALYSPEENEEIDVSMLSVEERKKHDYMKFEKEINSLVLIHKELKHMSELSDDEILERINEFNLLVSEEDSENEYKVFSNYLKFRMLSLPPVFANRFKFTGKGCLEDEMDLKMEEAIEDFELFKHNNSGQDGKRKGRTTLKDISKAIEERKNDKEPKNMNNHDETEK